MVSIWSLVPFTPLLSIWSLIQPPGFITPQYQLGFDDTFSTIFIWTNLLSYRHELHSTFQPDSTGYITNPPDCIPLDATSTPLSSSEGATTYEVVQLPTIQPPNSSDTMDTDLPVPDTPLVLDPADHLNSPSPLSPTEGATVTDHPPLSPTERASAPTLVPHRSQRSTVDLPPDWLSLLTYDANHHIQRPTLLGSTQTVFHINSKLLSCRSTMVISPDNVFRQARHSLFLHDRTSTIP